jgi:non-homologous end joining protein Ku
VPIGSDELRTVKLESTHTIEINDLVPDAARLDALALCPALAAIYR